VLTRETFSWLCAVVSELFNVVLPCVKEAKDIDPAGFPVNPENQQVVVNQRFAVSFSL
jgi:hypothetical protein